MVVGSLLVSGICLLSPHYKVQQRTNERTARRRTMHNKQNKTTLMGCLKIIVVFLSFDFTLLVFYFSRVLALFTATSSVTAFFKCLRVNNVSYHLQYNNTTTKNTTDRPTGHYVLWPLQQ